MFRDKLKSLISSNQEGEKQTNEKKKIENLVFFIVILIITVVAINIIWNEKKQTNKQDSNITPKKLALDSKEYVQNEPINESGTSNIEERLEERLEKILSKIEGVGDVKVFINYRESSEIVAMYNENSKVSNTEENDTSGGIRKIQSTDIQKDIRSYSSRNRSALFKNL